MEREEYIEHASKLGREAALDDLQTGNDRSGEDTIADTEALVHRVTNRKLFEFEDSDEEDLIFSLVEAYDEAYIDTYVAGANE